MADTPKWAAGTLYPTGALVQPLSPPPSGPVPITNSSFETGDATDWTLPAGASVTSGFAFSGTYKLEFTGTGGNLRVLHSPESVTPGKSITAKCMYAQGAASSGDNPARAVMAWFTSGMVEITAAESLGNIISSGSGGSYSQSTVSGMAPASAAFVCVGIRTTRNDSSPSYADTFTWNYISDTPPSGLIYRAVQPAVGTSGNTEPVWPLTLGVQVIDNTVTWEAVYGSKITYEAVPILLSGATEPTWPLAVDSAIVDNTINWIATTRQVTQAPNSKVVAITASKVFAADEDIIRYSATVNPRDWTSEDDAGYLPSGLNQYGSNFTSVLNVYRASLVSFSSSTFQNWQVDPDPANMSLLDGMEGIGSIFQQAAQPVAKDLFYLAALGVRTVGISVGSTNLVNGDAGMPIDPLIRGEITALSLTGYTPRGLYYPSLGQYWLAFGPRVYVYTFAEIGSIGAWSYYDFPWPVEGQAQLGDDLYLRSGDAVYRVDPERLDDQIINDAGTGFDGLSVDAEIQSHYLDFGAGGVSKMMIGFDIVGNGNNSPAVSIGFDQTNLSAFTPDFTVTGDTSVGFIVPLPVSAVSFAMRIRYSSNYGDWEWLASNFYVQDFRVTS